MTTEEQTQSITGTNQQDRTTVTNTASVSNPISWDEISTKENQSQTNSEQTNKSGQVTTTNQTTLNNKQQRKDSGIITKSERDEIRVDFRKSFKDLGRIPYLLILPLLNLIQSQYEKIPEDRRKSLARMVNDIKASGKSGIQKLTDRWNKKDRKKEDQTIDTNNETYATQTEKLTPTPSGSIQTTPPTGQTVADNGQVTSGYG